ncbi:hypothetical protein DESC_850016 [Desulfosarcina cetonica]|nr:hypothetical protein DESC_850016 [Desulfosarcina cetonica]
MSVGLGIGELFFQIFSIFVFYGECHRRPAPSSRPSFDRSPSIPVSGRPGTTDIGKRNQWFRRSMQSVVKKGGPRVRGGGTGDGFSGEVGRTGGPTDGGCNPGRIRYAAVSMGSLWDVVSAIYKTAAALHPMPRRLLAMPSHRDQSPWLSIWIC